MTHVLSNGDSRSTLNSTDRGEILFELQLDDSAVLSRLIKEMEDPNDNSILIMNEDGLRLMATGDKTSQVSAFFAKRIFNRFVFNAAYQIMFRFVLKEFVETLNLLQAEPDKDEPANSKVSLKITYRKKGEPLKLRLENTTNYTVTCDLREFSLPSIHTLMSFASYEEITEIRFHSRELYKFISSLDMSAPSVHLKLEPRTLGEDCIKWSAGPVTLELSTHDEPAIIKYPPVFPNNSIANHSYRMQLIKPALNALKSSKEMVLRCGSSGLLIMEHFHDGQSVEYYIPPEAKETNEG